ncbi:MAG: universal stress protein [Candidatus Bathyarchaeota archaeon]|nr:universal stress protein [Candidatus Bathyarchaeota archaeon]
MSIRKIMVPIDGSKPSEKAAEYALYLAKMMKAHVTAVHVMNLPAYAFTATPIEGVPAPAAIPIPLTISTEERKIAESYFDRIGEMAKKAEVAVETKIVENQQSVVHAITEFAEKEGCDLIVMGTKGRTGITRFLLGSVASGVVTYARCPVLVVR